MNKDLLKTMKADHDADTFYNKVINKSTEKKRKI